MVTSYMHYFTYHNGTQDNINDDNHSSNDCSGVAPYGAVLGAIFGSFVIITFMIMVCHLYIRYTYNRRTHQTCTIIDPQQILKVRPRLTSSLAYPPPTPPYTPSANYVPNGSIISSDAIPLDSPPNYTL